MVKVLSDFISVTDHYGYRLEVRFGSPMCVIYRSDRVRLGYEVTGRYSKKLAIAECNYLEKLNYERGCTC